MNPQLLALTAAFAACAPAIGDVTPDTDDDADPDVTYTATVLATALHRVLVARDEAGACAWFVLVNPAQPAPGVSTPPDWAYEGGGRATPGRCEGPWPEGTPADSASGDVTFDADPNTAIPGPMTIDLTLTFPEDPDVRFVTAGLVPE